MKITIVDVAKKANCSIATVSRVMNGNYPIAENTRKRVQEAIDELGFIPNIQAREIKKRNSKTVGVIVPSVDNLFFSEVIKGIEDTLFQKGYSLILSFSNNDKEQEMHCVSNMTARNVAGLIMADVDTANCEGGLIASVTKDIPVVLINGNPSTKDFSFVQTDEYEAARQSMEYLWGLGHRNICFVRGKNSYSYDIKQKAYLEFLNTKGIFGENFIYEVGEGNSMQVVYNAKKSLKKVFEKSEFTAAFCCNDLMAIGVVKACKHIGMRIPEDFSIIGFDNTALSEICDPKLTTNDQHMHNLGRESALLLLDNIVNKDHQNKRVVLSTDLVVRDSSAKVGSVWKRKK